VGYGELPVLETAIIGWGHSYCPGTTSNGMTTSSNNVDSGKQGLILDDSGPGGI
jgi:hypothetical protein